MFFKSIFHNRSIYLRCIKDLVWKDEVVPLRFASTLLLLRLVWVEDSLLLLQSRREEQEVVTSKKAKDLYIKWFLGNTLPLQICLPFGKERPVCCSLATSWKGFLISWKLCHSFFLVTSKFIFHLASRDGGKLVRKWKGSPKRTDSIWHISSTLDKLEMWTIWFWAQKFLPGNVGHYFRLLLDCCNVRDRKTVE